MQRRRVTGKPVKLRYTTAAETPHRTSKPLSSYAVEKEVGRMVNVEDLYTHCTMYTVSKNEPTLGRSESSRGVLEIC